MTYNIQRGGRGRVDAIARVIGACAPDVVLLQEATDPAVVARIAAATGMAEGGAFAHQSLGFLSRRPVARSVWIRPLMSRHAFIEIVPGGSEPRLFGVHLSAIHAAWTERRRIFEVRGLLRRVVEYEHGFHVLGGDFNTLAPGEPLDLMHLPFRLRPFLWLSGGRVRWKTVQTVLDAGYVDAFRLLHPTEPGCTMPSVNPHVRLDYLFVPQAFAHRVVSCDVVHHPDVVAASDHCPVMAELSLS
jgi:endonuclease/exonuclease/phosphatase family metal-dependent hydrolase